MCSSPARPCPTGMTYQQCGPLCPQTCDNLDQPCEGGCAEGCFCPFEEVLLGGVCVNNSQCEGLFELEQKMILKSMYTLYSGTSVI